jgi:hypothetical protein
MTKQRIFTIALIVIGVAITLFFGMGAVRAFRHMEGHGPFGGKPPAANQTDVSAIRDWMTIPYIAHMYDVPPKAIFKNLQIHEDEKDEKMSLAQLNEKYYPDQDGVVLAQVQALMQAFQKQGPPPPFPSTPAPAPTAPAAP